MDAPISHDELGELYAQKLRKKCQLAVANYSHIHTWEKPDVVVWIGGFSVHLIETKVSKSDFKRAMDQHSLEVKWGHPPAMPTLTDEEKSLLSLQVKSLSEILQPSRERGPELEI